MKLLLHVGTHKTGTTSIQFALANDRLRLRSLGIEYPELAKLLLPGAGHNHNPLANALASSDTEPAALASFQEHIEALGANADLTVISGEVFFRQTLDWSPGVRDMADPEFYRARRAYLDRVSEFFSSFEVEVIIYFRRVATFAESFFIQNQLDTGQFPTLASNIRARAFRYAYDEHIQTLRSVFPCLRVRNYHAASEAGLIASFYKEIGASEPRTSPERYRISPPNAAALWIGRRNDGRSTPPAEKQAVRQFLASEDAIDLFARRAYTLWPSAGFWSDFCRNYESVEAPWSNSDPDAPPMIVPWEDEDQEEAEALYQSWLFRSRTG